MEKFFIIAMKPGGFPGFLSADGHRCGIYTAAFFNKLCQKQAVFSIAVFCTAAKQQGKRDSRSQQALSAYSKTDCAIPPAIIPAYRFPFRNMVGAAFFLHLDIENDHIGPGIPFKLRKNSRLITIFIHNIRIRKKADVPFRPKNGLIAASADATVGKTAETDSSVSRRYLHFLLPQPVALIDDHRVRLQVHMLYGLRKRSIHYRCQNFYLHACSPPCSVFCVCMAPGRK